MADLAEKLRRYRDVRAAHEAWDHDFTASPHFPWVEIEKIAEDPAGPVALVELLRSSDRKDRSDACYGLECCAARCGPEVLAALEEAWARDGAGAAAIEAIQPERFWQLNLHRVPHVVEGVAEKKISQPGFPAWFDRLLRESTPEGIAALLGRMLLSSWRLRLDEPVLALLRRATHFPNEAVSGPATQLLTWLSYDESTEDLIDSMVRSEWVYPPRVAGHPKSEILVELLIRQGDVYRLGDLLERRRCAGLPNHPAICRALIREQLERPTTRRGDVWSGFSGAAHCARELMDPELLPVLVAAVVPQNAGGWDKLRDALLTYGSAAVARVEQRVAETTGEVRERSQWMLAELRKAFLWRSAHGDGSFIEGKIDEAFDLYSRVLRQRPEAHAAFQLAWIDRACGAPVLPARVRWIRELGFRDEELLSLVGQRVSKPFTQGRLGPIHQQPERAKQAIDAGLFGMARDDHPRWKDMGEAHVARVRAACA